MKKIEEENIIKSKIERVKKWDGFLDISSRRDGKIKKILG